MYLNHVSIQPRDAAGGAPVGRASPADHGTIPFQGREELLVPALEAGMEGEALGDRHGGQAAGGDVVVDDARNACGIGADGVALSRREGESDRFIPLAARIGEGVDEQQRHARTPGEQDAAACCRKAGGASLLVIACEEGAALHGEVDHQLLAEISFPAEGVDDRLGAVLACVERIESAQAHHGQTACAG